MTDTGSPRFTLHVVATSDGFIARYSGHSPADWQSEEDAEYFFAAVDAADWSVMGRVTHTAAPRADRRRVVFSTATPVPDWRTPTQVWLDPRGLTPDALPDLLCGVHPVRDVLILGGTRVHDWFLAHGRLDAVTLCVEPLRFGEGLPIFTGDGAGDPVASFTRRGFEVVDEQALNARGTRRLWLEPALSAR